MLLAIAIGFLSAFIGSLVGLGGGIILVPMMLYLHNHLSAFSWANPQAIVGISLVTMVFTGLSATLTYYKQKRVDIKTGVTFLVGSLPGIVFGSWLNSVVHADKFSLYFGILMLFIFFLMLLDREKIMRSKPIKLTKRTRTFHIDGETYQYNVNYIPALLISFIVGLLSGLFGIGGGTITVPAMLLFFGIPIQIAVSTSMFIIFFTSLIGASTHIVLGHIVWSYVLFFIIGSYIGGTVGAKTNRLLKGKTLEWILKIVIVITALQLIYESF